MDRGEAVARKIGDGIHEKFHFRPNGRMEKRVREGKGEDSRAVRDNRPYQVALSEFSQRFPDEVAGGERGVQAGEGFLRLGRFVTEGEKGEEGVLRISG